MMTLPSPRQSINMNKLHIKTTNSTHEGHQIVSAMKTKSSTLKISKLKTVKKDQNKHKIYSIDDLDAASDTNSIRVIKKKKRKAKRAIHRKKIAIDYENRAAVDDSFVHFLGSLN